MAGWLLQHEATLRLAAFLAVLALLLLGERLRPRRPLPGGWRRRGTHFVLVALDTLALRLAFPLLAIGAAAWAGERQWGLFPALAMPAWIAGLLGFLLLDLAMYGQHRLLHSVPLLWRLHRVHHADLGFDCTTGLRFHPLEILLSMAIKIGLVLLLGIPVLAVLAFEIVLNAGSLFSHANLAVPGWLERPLRWWIVTPDMHRVHHSVHRDETDSNFGFHLSCWDRLFASYRAGPRDGHGDMQIGLPQWRSAKAQTLAALLANPFRRAE